MTFAVSLSNCASSRAGAEVTSGHPYFLLPPYRSATRVFFGGVPGLAIATRVEGRDCCADVDFWMDG